MIIIHYHFSETKTRTVKVEREKTSKLLSNITADNITVLNELIYVGTKL